MRRRALLSSLAATTAALAGCASGAGSDPTARTTSGNPSRRTTGSGTTADDGSTPDDEPDGYASVVELDTGPRTYSLVPTRLRTDDGASVAFWFDRTATADHPPRIRGWLENANPYENTFEVEWIPVVGRTHGRQPRGYDHEASLHFAPTENNDLAETVPEVVRDESGFWRVADVGPWMTERTRLDPGERVELEYVLVGEPGMPGRPTGTYEFRGRGAQASLTVWDTTSPGPDTESRFAGRSLPALGEESSTQWFHDADESTVAYLEPRHERAELDAALGVEFVNNSHETVSCGHWNLHKFVDGEWFHVAPTVHNADCRMLPPGARRAWTLRAFNAEPVPCAGPGGGSSGCGDGLTQGYLGGGEYAVVAGYGHPQDQSAALVELVGDPVEIVPTDDATIDADGDTATVTLPECGDGNHPADASFALTRTGDADERLLPEQVMASGGFGSRRRGLRNALAAMDESLERVVVRADEHVVGSALEHESGPRRVEVRGQAYEVARVDGPE